MKEDSRETKYQKKRKREKKEERRNRQINKQKNFKKHWLKLKRLITSRLTQTPQNHFILSAFFHFLHWKFVFCNIPLLMVNF